MRYELSPQDVPLSPFFVTGIVEIDCRSEGSLKKATLIEVLERHCNRDFGTVPFSHHFTNLDLIENQEGVIVSEYTTTLGLKISIVTRLDNFDPCTIVYVD